MKTTCDVCGIEMEPLGVGYIVGGTVPGIEYLDPEYLDVCGQTCARTALKLARERILTSLSERRAARESMGFPT